LKIFINGQEREFLDDNISLYDIIVSLGIDGKVMAAAINSMIVKKDNWNTHLLQNGDKVELLQFTGGG
jgi:sulfur carrier protein